ncbi:hypothetical protein ILUMI_03684 [Ignelater luminosus]|uniref:Protein sleepless n=1 Tax=Ignelater luminosus TaxID=2038154 RepID=A0A8K0GLX9_IGNLU|nr:hypothetical protein ILUMI_03684 [Ignelater luminosus]
MMHTVFVFFYLSLLGNCLSLQCFHCIDKNGVCKHPSHHYPPVSFCGFVKDGGCVVFELRLYPYTNLSDTGRFWTSFGVKAETARFRGCVNEYYCDRAKKKSWQLIGLAFNYCEVCYTHYCNSGSNLIPFFVVKLLIFGIAVPYLFVLFLKSGIY